MDSLEKMGQQAQAAERELSQLATPVKNQVLGQMAQALRQNQAEIMLANQHDLNQATDLPMNFVDRLTLTAQRIEQMALGLEKVASLPDPIGNIEKGWQTKQGLKIEQQRVPLGVIGIIYEARSERDGGCLCADL
jgi:Gamma-glutamyl phosphate reductase